MSTIQPSPNVVRILPSSAWGSAPDRNRSACIKFEDDPPSSPPLGEYFSIAARQYSQRRSAAAMRRRRTPSTSSLASSPLFIVASSPSLPTREVDEAATTTISIPQPHAALRTFGRASPNIVAIVPWNSLATSLAETPWGTTRRSVVDTLISCRSSAFPPAPDPRCGFDEATLKLFFFFFFLLSSPPQPEGIVRPRATNILNNRLSAPN
mmetsp:Transcript_38758/g.93276  ORF Transcript_38758/g.93276 Transcript_38758/m.93276 type:complete len:209 (-) Transcript_38758:17-643(-)